MPLCYEEDSLDLLGQFEDILDHDALIDEVGFIHPSQLLMLKKEADAVFLSPDRREADVISSSEISGAEGVEGENAFSGIEITNWAFRLHVFFHCIKQQNTDSWRLL